MRNPLNKRIPKELKQEFGKYFVIFAFLVMLIGIISGFLVATHSMQVAADEAWETYNIENGHFTFDREPEQDLLDEISKEADITIYDLAYINAVDENEKKIRVYRNREDVNLVCLMEGKLPKKEDEIAIDRLFATKSDYKIGDHMQLYGKDVVITGLVALSDYSCLYENNTDMMFNATNFTVAIMTDAGFESLGTKHITYNYAWTYNKEVAREDDKRNQDLSDDLIEDLEDIITAYDEDIVKDALMAGKTMTQAEEEIIKIEDYVPQYKNQAINFAREDMGGDSAMFTIFYYLVTLVIAFVFAVTISNTIVAEAGVIGTLRASGYTKGELLRHYMTLPVLVTLIAAVIGNILGYSVLKQTMVDMYYNSYSLTTYTTLWNAGAFVKTTVVPVILMFLVNLVALIRKLRLAPIRFLRRDLSKRGRKKAFRLNTKIPFMHRFRIRVIFQNISNYLTLFFGVFLGGAITIFSLMFGPLLDDYRQIVLDQRICDYQYIMRNQDVKVDNEQAEKFCMYALKTSREDFVEDEISVYGVDEDSDYIKADMPEDGVLISSAYQKKYGIETGETITLKDTYAEKDYTFQVNGVYEYDAGLAVFMPRAEYNKTFSKDADYFTGFFSREELTELDEDDIVSVITLKDITKLSDQLTDSVGGFMDILKFFGVIMFLLLMYLLSKQIIEKNAQSISMTKILGFYNGEIGSVYIVATSIVIVISLLATCPAVAVVLRFVFENYIYKMMPGYIPYIISNECYIKMIAMGIGCYIVIAVLQMIKIGRISKVDALKNVE